MWTNILYGLPVVFGVVAWAFRLEGRVNTSDQRMVDLKELLITLITSKFDDQNRRLARIEQALNGAWKNADHP